MKKRFMKGLAASLILAMSVTTVAPAMAAEEAAPKATESTAKAANTNAVYNGYLGIIQKYKVAQDHDFYRNDVAAGEQSGINTTINWIGTKKAYYTLVDISHDGIPELFIADCGNEYSDFKFNGGYNILDSYTFAQGGVHRLAANGYKIYDSIMKDGTIREQISSGARDHYIQFLTLPKDSAALIPGVYVQHVAWSGDEYYRGMGQSQTKKPISKAEYDRILAQYSLKTDIVWHPIQDSNSLKKELEKNQPQPAVPVKIMLNGQELKCDQPPVIQNGRTLVPFRAILEGMKAKVGWDGDTRTVTASLDGIDLSLKIGSKTMYKNGQPISLDVPAQIINSRTLIPARAVTEALGAKVDWDANTRTVTVVQTTNPEPKPQPQPQPKPEPKPQPPVEDQREKSYQAACQILDQGYSYNAYYSFKKLGNYKDSPQRMKTAKLLNYLSYNYNDYTSKQLRDQRGYYEHLNENQIRALMPTAQWYVPNSQSAGYNIDNFYADGSWARASCMFPNNYSWGSWSVGKNMINGNNPFVIQGDFRKLTRGVYTSIMVQTQSPMRSGPTAMVYIDTQSPFGHAYKAVADRMVRAYCGTKNDGNGLYYLVDQYGQSIYS